jgi:hypothetical protein
LRCGVRPASRSASHTARPRPRAGKSTVNSLYGTRIAVLVGDFLFAQSSWFLANLDNLEVIKLISQVRGGTQPPGPCRLAAPGWRARGSGPWLCARLQRARWPSSPRQPSLAAAPL